MSCYGNPAALTSPCHHCSGDTTYYVKPTSDTACLAEPCLTLSEYAQQPHQYLTSNTTLLLLPGVHVLSVNLTVENVSSFEICAQLISPTNKHPKSRVVCIGLVGLTFRNVSNIRLDGLRINSCGKGAATYGPIGDYLTTCGMSIVSGEDIMIVNCSFEDSVGTALGVFYSNLNLHGNNFTKNCSGHLSRSSGLVARLLTNTSNMFISENKVTNNSAEYGTVEESHQRKTLLISL